MHTTMNRMGIYQLVVARAERDSYELLSAAFAYDRATSLTPSPIS